MSATFSSDQVVVLAVAWEEGPVRVSQYVADTGLRVPVVMDHPGVDANCWDVPEGEESLYFFFNNRIPLSMLDSPFPLQILVAPDRTLAHASRQHQPDVILQKLGSMVP